MSVKTVFGVLHRASAAINYQSGMICKCGTRWVKGYHAGSQLKCKRQRILPAIKLVFLCIERFEACNCSFTLH